MYDKKTLKKNNIMENEKQVLYPAGGEITFFMPNTNTIGKLKDAKPQQSLTAKYMTVEDWKESIEDEKRCIFLGLKDAMDNKGEMYYMAKFIDQYKNPFVCAQKIIVQAMANVPPGQAVAITCTEIKRNAKNGHTALFDICDLGFNVFENDPA